MQSAPTVPAFDLRISIEDTEPLVWRTLRVPTALTIAEFHLAVQAAFGWENRLSTASGVRTPPERRA